MKEKKKNKKGQGRKSEYLPKYAHIAEQYFKEGKLNKDLEKLLGVSENTLSNWRKQYPEFDKAFEAKSEANARVEASLLMRACGMVVWEEKESKTGEIIRLKKQIPPDSSAAAKWLNNRDPERWRDKQELHHTGEMQITVNVGLKEPNKS